MKKTLTAISALAVMIGLSTSCQKELSGGQETIGDNPFSITASIAGSGTKVSYAEDGSTHELTPSWQVGDVIIGFDGDGNTYGYSVTEVNTETKKATLEIIASGDNAGGKTVNPANDTKMYMFYAPGKTPANISDKSLTVSLASQDKDVVPALMMSSATVTNSSLSLVFENKTAIIGVKTPTMAMANKAYTSLALSGSAGLNTAVKFDLSGTEGALNATYQTTGTIKKTLDFTSDASTKVGPDVIYIVACPLASAADLTFTFNGNEEYFKVAGATMEAGSYYYMTPTTGKQKFAITVQGGITGGTITTSPEGTCAWGETVTVTATPATGYELATLKYNDGSDHNITVTGNTETFEMLQANVTVSGTFQLKDFDITKNAATGGTYTVQKGSPLADATTGKMNEEIFVSVTPNEGYSGGTVTVKKTGTDEYVTFDTNNNKVTMPASPVTITVTFTHDTYTITGTVAPESTGTVTFKKSGSEDGITQAYYNDVITVEATPATGYELKSITWTPEGGSDTDITSTKTFTMPAKNVTVTVTFKKSINGHDYVMIGGKKWATTNIGATNPQDYGRYFQWGEIAGHECSGKTNGSTFIDGHNFDWAHAPFNDESSSYDETYFTDNKGTWLNSDDVLKPDYDAAYKSWGSSWRMPTKDDFINLDKACGGDGNNGQSLTSISKTSHIENGKVKKGRYWLEANQAELRAIDELKNITAAGMLYSDGENYLFFPAAGIGYSGNLLDAGTYGYYWSSTLFSDNTDSAYYLNFLSGNVYPQDYYYRYYGFSVRPLSD